jgi:hypothetical protein
MNSSYRPLLLGCLLAFFTAHAQAADDAVMLRWQFRKGEFYQFRLRHREVRNVSVADQKLEATTDSDYEWRWTVRAVEKDVAILDLELKSARVTSNGAQAFEFQYDSTAPARFDDEYRKKLAQIYDQLRVTKLRLEMKPNGQIVKLEGLDKLLSDLEVGQVNDFHGINLRDATFGWFLQQALGVLPDAGVAPGATWKTPYKAKIGDLADWTAETECTLDKPRKDGDRELAVIGCKGKQSFAVDMKWLNNELKGMLETSRSEGTFQFDAKAGRLHKSEMRIDYAGDLKLGENKTVFKFQFRHILEVEAK